VTELAKPPANVKRWPNGEPIVVVRPANPRKVLALAAVSVQHQSQEAMWATVEGSCTFVGYLTQDSKVTYEGVADQELQEGDLLVEPRAISYED
jgi:hypothetical protein